MPWSHPSGSVPGKSSALAFPFADTGLFPGCLVGLHRTCYVIFWVILSVAFHFCITAPPLTGWLPVTSVGGFTFWWLGFLWLFNSCRIEAFLSPLAAACSICSFHCAMAFCPMDFTCPSGWLSCLIGFATAGKYAFGPRPCCQLLCFLSVNTRPKFWWRSLRA